MTRYRRRGEVRGTRLTEVERWTTNSGDALVGEPGDWKVTDDTGGVRTIKNSEFLASHELIVGDRYRRAGTVSAEQVDEVTTVETLEGAATAQPGDWIVTANGDDSWPVPDAHFRAKYESVDLWGTSSES